MKTNFIHHFSLGLLLALLLAYSSYAYNFPNPLILPACTLALLFGSIAPDIDHPLSRPRRFLRFFFLLPLLALCSLFFISSFSRFCSSFNFSCQLALVFFSLGPFAALFFLELFIPPHRGFLHSKKAVFLYALLCLAFSLFFARPADALLVSACGALGYFSHILLDAFGSRF